MGKDRVPLQITALVFCASFLLASCIEPMETESFVADTVANVGCEVDFRESLFDNIFKNLSQGKSLPAAHELAPHLSTQLSKLEASDSVRAEHMAKIKAAYLRVYEVILRYRDQDLGLPGSYGHWLADIEDGTYFNQEQSEWAKDLNNALKDLDAAAKILDSKCADAPKKPEVVSTPISNDALYLSVETLKLRGPEGQEYIQERKSNPYLERGYYTTPARIYTDENVHAQPPVGPGEQQPVANSEELQNLDAESLEPAPSNWTPLQAYNTTVNIRPPEVTATPDPSPSTPPQFNSTPAQVESDFDGTLFRSYHPLFAGALKTMAVLYQSCSVLALPLVDSSNAPRLQGLQTAGRDRIYSKPLYKIADQELFSQTHYYLSQLDQSHDPELAQCRNTRDEFQSMYVYSGEADVTSVERNNSSVAAINLFRQASASGLEPGMDCSAFVSVAFQAAGLKFKTGGSCRAYRRIGSTTSLINYEGNGYNCLFEPQKDATNTHSETGPIDLAPGDVFTVQDHHTVIIGQTGWAGEIPDPFRLRRITDISQCRIENFDYSVFDFDIIHSSATRSQSGTGTDTGLGVARHHARSYFPTDPVMGNYLRNYAVQACKRKFNPQTEPYRMPGVNILRYRPAAECMCPERTLLFKESCLNSCSLPQQ